MSMIPLQLAFYKGTGGKWGAIQFNPQRPYFYIKGEPTLKNYDGKFIPDLWLKEKPQLEVKDLASREGAIFVEIASTVNKNEYDWKNKITMALSVNDLGKILTVLEGQVTEVKIMHDPGAKSSTAGQVQKYLAINSPRGLKDGCLFNVAEKTKDGIKKHQVPLTGDEVILLRNAIQGFIPVALGWAQ